MGRKIQARPPAPDKRNRAALRHQHRGASARTHDGKGIQRLRSEADRPRIHLHKVNHPKPKDDENKDVYANLRAST